MTQYGTGMSRMSRRVSRRQPPPWPIWAVIGALVFTNIVTLVLLIGDDDGGDGEVAATDTTLDDSASSSSSPLDTTTTSSTMAVELAGDASQITAALQQDLADLGYYDGPIDGVYDEATEDAIREFQTDNGLAVDGRYGPETYEAMAAAKGEAGTATVVALQEALTEQGYYTGAIDGIYGEGTIAAVKAAQEDLGITADGIIGPETIAAWEAAFGAGGTGTSDTPTVSLQTSDGVNATLDVTICDSAAEDDLTLTARTETAELTAELGLEATSGSGTVIYDASSGRREGTVDSVAVGDDGEIDASGELTLTDDGATPATFTLSGQCA